MATNKTPAVPVAEETLPATVREQFAQMALMLPRVQDDAGADEIVRQILAATSWDDLDAPWEGIKGEELVGVPLKIESAQVYPSDFADGLGVYLRVDAFRLDTGEKVNFSTGSVSIVAQIVKAYVEGWLPLFGKIVQSERPTEKGYFPQHLVVTDSAAAS